MLLIYFCVHAFLQDQLRQHIVVYCWPRHVCTLEDQADGTGSVLSYPEWRSGSSTLTPQRCTIFNVAFSKILPGQLASSHFCNLPTCASAAHAQYNKQVALFRFEKVTLPFSPPSSFALPPAPDNPRTSLHALTPRRNAAQN